MILIARLGATTAGSDGMSSWELDTSQIDNSCHIPAIITG
jgi:hypothetical protein